MKHYSHKHKIFDAHLEFYSWRFDSNYSLDNFEHKLDGIKEGVSPNTIEANFDFMKKSNIRLTCACLNSALSYNYHLKDIIRQIDDHTRMEQDSKGKLIRVTSKCDFDRIKSENKFGYILYLENVSDIDSKLQNVRILFEAGVRIIGLVWNHTNAIGGTQFTPSVGLSSLGRRLIRLMERNHMIVDLAHTSKKTFMDATSVLKRPFVVTHTACRSVFDHPRNLDDEQLRIVRNRRGVIGIFLVPEFLNKNKRDISAWCDHLDHAVKVAGIDSVGIGSDFGGMLGHVPSDIRNAGEMHVLGNVLTRRGYSDGQITKILFDNWATTVRKLLPETERNFVR